jgi:superfamily II DNA or RNA helicase
MGVDGVFDTAVDEYVCYQAKFRTGRPSLAWTEIATFFGLADFAAQRLLFTNCDDVSEIAEQRRNVVFIRGSDLDRLTIEDFNAMRAWLAGAAVDIPTKSPKPHQEKAIDKIVHAFATKTRVTALMACGTGKTLVALWTAERLEARSVLVLVPSLALVRQVLHEWLHETNWSDVEYLCVCSDESVDRGNDELLVRPSDVDFKVTTQTSVVRQFLNRESTATKLVFCTYQSSGVVATAAEGLRPFDFGVFDEAHKTAGREGAKFGVALADERLEIARRLFMTATPRHYDVEVRDKSGDAKLVYSMDVPEVYGPVAHRLPFSEAAELDIITDYEVLVSFVTSEMVTNELLRRGVVLVEGEEIKAQQVANQIALQSAIKNYGATKIFTFHSRVASARSFTSSGPEGIHSHLPDFHCAHVNGAMPTAHRERLMREFAGAPRALLSNARCLTEGVDLPAVDMVAFLSPRRSLVDIVQAVGRAMRKSPGKKVGYVLVPLYVEQARNESIKDAVLRSNFDEVWRVLQRLKEHDDLLAQIIADMRIERGKTGGFDDSRFREKVHVLGPELALEDLRRFISSACVDAIGESWFECYGELISYKKAFGNCDVPKRMRERKKLANWVVQQRVSRNAGTLSQDKIALLDRLEFKWHPGGHRWRANYLALREYKERVENCRVPQKWKENPVLARWVQEQRRRRKANQLSDDRIQLLDELGFDWTGDVSSWEQRFEQLREYKERFGNTRVPVHWTENPKLGGWVTAQRYRKRSNRLNSRYEKRLTELGFDWELEGTITTASWERMLQALITFKAKNGHLDVRRETENESLAQWIARQRRRFREKRLTATQLERLTDVGFEFAGKTQSVGEAWDRMFAKLAKISGLNGSLKFHRNDNVPIVLKRWCTEQRKLRSAGQLSDQQIDRLNSIGFEWLSTRGKSMPKGSSRPDTTTRSWQQMFDALVEYFKIHGDYNVPQRWAANPELGRWVMSQRSAKRQDRISAEHERKLTAIGFNWRVHDASWDKMFEKIRLYLAKPSARSRKSSIPATLRSWAITQRLSYRRGTLDADRVAKLSNIGFEWDPHESRWQKLYAQLQEYESIHNHCRVPAEWKDNPQLAHWVAVQRRQKKLSRLPTERITKLELLGFDWNSGGSPRATRAPKADHWDQTLIALKAFKEERGHCRVPQRFKENGQLADWVSRVRTSRNKGKLSAEQKRILTELGFDWNPVRNRWDYMFDQLVEYKKEHGHTNVPQHSGKYLELAHWVRNQRAAKRYNRPIIAERGKRLDEIGFSWRLVDPLSWESMFESLGEFKKIYGHRNVPQHWKENKRLGKWVNTQRTAYKRGKLSAEKQKLLEEIGFAWRLPPTNKRLVPLSTSVAA